MPNMAIVFHSGYGHTKVMAEAVAVAEGAKGELVAIHAGGNFTEAQWTALAAGDAIFFGSPTCMGSVS